MSNTLNFAMSMIENMAKTDAAAAATAAVELHRSEQFRSDMMTLVVPAVVKAYGDFQVRENARLEIRRAEAATDAVRAEAEAAREKAEAEKVAGFARFLATSEFRLNDALEAEVARRIEIADRSSPRPSNGAYHREDALAG